MERERKKNIFIDITTLYESASWIITLIIHVSECISGSATCIEDIYNDANRTRQLCTITWLEYVSTIGYIFEPVL